MAGVKNEVSENKDTKVESPMMATNMAAVEAANDKKLSDAKAHAAAFEEAQRVRAANDKKLSDATEKILTNPSLSNIWTALDVSALSWKEARTLTGVPADGTWQPGKTWQELGTAMPNAFHYFSQTLDEKAAAAKVDLSGLHPVVRVDAYLQLSRLALLRKMNWTGSADDTPDTSKWSDPPADLKRHYDDRIEEYRNIASGK